MQQYCRAKAPEYRCSHVAFGWKSLHLFRECLAFKNLFLGILIAEIETLPPNSQAQPRRTKIKRRIPNTCESMEPTSVASLFVCLFCVLRGETYNELVTCIADTLCVSSPLVPFTSDSSKHAWARSVSNEVSTTDSLLN